MSNAERHIGTASLIMMRAGREVPTEPTDVIRAWPRVTLAAHHLSLALGATETNEGRAIEQIAIDAYSMARSGAHNDWPGAGPRDQELLKVAMAIEAAAKTAGPGASEPEYSGALLGRTLAVLWIASEYAGNAARDVVADLDYARDLNPSARAQIAARARDAARRIDASERIAGEFVGVRQVHSADSASGRLHRAIAQWDVEAHRTIVFEQSTMVLHGIARMEAMTNAAFAEFVSNATAAGYLDSLAAERLAPALESLPKSWDTVGDATADIAFGPRPLPTQFIEAAEDLRNELSRAIDIATPEEQAAMVSAVKLHAATSMSVASSAQDLLADQELRGPARAVSRMIVTAKPGLIASPVDPRDIHRGLTIALPPEARDILADPIANCVLDSHELVRRTASLDSITSTAPAPPSTDVHRMESKLRPSFEVPTRSPAR
jgi:hypothetical protein